jgi:pSer/pThr/pTyr-binding forkhead associated (FHA) protein
MHLNKNTLPERHFLLFNNSARKLILLNQGSYKIGRSLCNEIVIEGNPISRFHARLQKIRHYAGGIEQYQIFDGISDETPSKNGVFVNELRSVRHTLKNGDIISFANIIKALYIRTSLSDFDFERFQESVVSDPLVLSSFLENEIAIAVDSHLSNLDYTTIMLGGPSLLSKETVSFER